MPPYIDVGRKLCDCDGDRHCNNWFKDCYIDKNVTCSYGIEEVDKRYYYINHKESTKTCKILVKKENIIWKFWTFSNPTPRPPSLFQSSSDPPLILLWPTFDPTLCILSSIPSSDPRMTLIWPSSDPPPNLLWLSNAPFLSVDSHSGAPSNSNKEEED